MDQRKNGYDVLVIGGGPAGSTVATLLALKGHRVLVLERERFPRFHIGESLMPQTWWTFEKLGMIERLEKSEFVRKHSVQFISETGKASRPFYFSEFNPHKSSITWQVERSVFDQMLLDRSKEVGAEVRHGVSVREVLFRDGRAVGVRAAPVSPPELGCEPEGPGEEITARVVVDASGQTSLINRQLGLFQKDPHLAKGAVFAHYRGALRDTGIDEGAILVVHTKGNRGWFWFIPLSRDRVSVGVVGSSAELFGANAGKGADTRKGRGGPEKALEEEIEASPEIRRRLVGAERVSPVHVLRDFSYRATRCAGDGWVLAGDAFGFLDPVYSSGVFLALKSGEMAAESVHAALEAGDTSGKRLGAHGPAFARGMEVVRKLVYAFYTPGFSFANFVREHPEHRRSITDILIGDVFRDGVEDIFQDMGRYCELPPPRPLEEPISGAR